MTNFQKRIIIIGGGIAGALAAYKLSKRGFKVIILEAGADRSNERIKMSGNYARTTRKTPGSPYLNKSSTVQSPDFREITDPDNKEAHYYDFNLDDENNYIDVFKSSYERILGGTTWHWLGNVPRFIPNDFKLKSLYGVGKDWPISYNDLEEYYCEAEYELGVSCDHEIWNNYLGAYRSRPYPMSKIWQTYGDYKVIEKADGKIINDKLIKILPTPQARNSENYDGRPPCAGNSSCVPICPIQAKYDATIHIEKAKREGTKIIQGAVVHTLIKNKLDIISKIVYRDISCNKDIEIDTTNDIIILAAHSIEIPKILLSSNIANSSKMVGKNLMDHAQGYVVALTKEPVFPFRGPLTTSGIDIYRDGKERKKQAAFRLSIGNDGWGRVKSPNAVARDFILKGYRGKELSSAIGNHITKMIRISFSTEVLPKEKNKVELSQHKDKLGLRRPKISFKIDEYNYRAFTTARKVCTEIFKLIGTDEIQDLSERSYSGAGHILGTTVMGKDPRVSVVNDYGKTHDHDNLFIVGSSVFPTSGTANPTLTIAALTLRTSEFIVKKHLK